MREAARRAVYNSGTLDPDARAYLARVPGMPEYWQQYVDRRVKRIKFSFDWSRVKKLHFLNAPSTLAALTDIKVPTTVASVINAPVFTPNVGYAGDAVSASINFGTLGATGALQDSATVGANIIGGTDVANGNAYAFGVSNNGSLALLPRNASNVIAVRINNTATVSFASTVATAYGRSMLTRRGASDIEGFRDGASVGTLTTASAALPGNPMTLFRLNTLYSDFLINEFWVLDGVTATEAAAFNAALASN